MAIQRMLSAPFPCSPALEAFPGFCNQEEPGRGFTVLTFLYAPLGSAPKGRQLYDPMWPFDAGSM